MSSEIEEIFTTTFEGGFTGVLGADKNGNLYWNGKAVITEQKITLEWWVNVSIITASISTVVMAVISCLNFFK